jgi:hypothetical protein
VAFKGIRGERLKEFMAVAALVAVSAAYFRSVLDGAYLLNERDLSVFFIPPRLLWVDIIKGGEFPLWNPYYYGGHPLFATLQPGVLYPLNLLLLILPFDLAFNWTIILHFPLAGVFTYLLLKDLGAGHSGRLMGALTFMLSGYLFSVHNLMSTLFSVAWVPLAALLFLRSMRRSSFLYSCLAGAVLAIMLFAGGIEVVYLTVAFLLYLSVLPRSFDIAGADGRYAAPLRRLVLLAAAIAVFLLLSAVQAIPFAELARQSTRASGLSYFEATTWSLDVKDFIQFFIPDPYGNGINDEKYWSNQSWLKSIYTGAVPFAFAVFLMFRARTRALAFMLLFLISVALAMGRNTLFYPYLYAYMPFIAKFRYPVKFLFIAFLLLSTAAGLGLDAFLRGAEERDRRVERAVAVMLALSTAAALGFGALSYFDGRITSMLVQRGIDYPEYNHVNINLFNAKRVLFFFVAFSVVLYAGCRATPLRRLLSPLVIVILGVDLFFAHSGYYAAVEPGEYHEKGAVMEFLSRDPGLYRVFVTPKTVEGGVAVPDDGSYDATVLKGLLLEKEKLGGFNLEHRIFDVSGVEVMKRGDYATLQTMLSFQEGPDSTSILKMLNVKYVVSIPRIESASFALREVVGAKEGGDMTGLEGHKSIKVYEYLDSLPRFYVAGGFRKITRPEEYAAALLDKTFSPATEVLLEEDPFAHLDAAERPAPGGPPGGASRGAGERDAVTVERYSNNSIDLRVKAGAPGILVASESYYPGWKAYVDGVERKVMKADFVFRAVAVEAGEHTVRFVYEPLSFRAGAWISVLSAIALISAGVYAGIKRQRESIA